MVFKREELLHTVDKFLWKTFFIYHQIGDIT